MTDAFEPKACLRQLPLARAWCGSFKSHGDVFPYKVFVDVSIRHGRNRYLQQRMKLATSRALLGAEVLRALQALSGTKLEPLRLRHSALPALNSSPCKECGQAGFQRNQPLEGPTFGQ